jgi:raffinose/stachyose/melibiose transport system permease protein
MTATSTLGATERIVLGSRVRPRPSRGYGSGLPWILPALVLVIGLIYFAIGYTGYVSTLDWNGFILSPSEPVGAANYAQMLQDPVFWGALGHTAWFFVVTFTIQTAIGFSFAALVHSKIALAPVYKVIIFIPSVLAPATMAPVFRAIFDADGQFNWLLSHIGLDFLTRPWLAEAETAMPVIMAITIWQWTGLTFILYFAAMSQIDQEVLEAARVDGASNLRSLVSIIWPMCSGTTLALATLGVIGALKTFDIPFLVTRGGPNYATEFLGTYIYRAMTAEKHFGFAAAIAVALLVLSIACGLLMRLRRKEA